VIAALAFLTPIGRGRAPSPDTARWFPVVGLLIGSVVGLVWWGASEVWSPGVAAALAVSADLALTGMLHFDGLVDSADGLLPHLPRDRRLAVMTEPTVGAFGVVVVVVVLLVRWAALASMPVDVWLIAGLWMLSRALMSVVLSSVPYARPEGLATAFRGHGLGAALAGGALAALLTSCVGAAAVAIVPAAGLAGAAVVALAVRRLGGYTGDVLGAAGVVAETVGLLVAAAKW
jgi:adenosylcobinamide-GDP ribazoletransferase